MYGEGMLKRYYHIGCITMMRIKIHMGVYMGIDGFLMIRDIVVSPEVSKHANKPNLAIRDKISRNIVVRETLYW